MFYRIGFGVDLTDRIKHIQCVSKPELRGFGRFESGYSRDPWKEPVPEWWWPPLCKGYRATVYPKWATEQAYIVKLRSGKVPDWYGPVRVSEKVKQVIEQVDPIGHRFYPLQILNEAGDSVVEQPYYILWVYRRLAIPILGLSPITRHYPTTETSDKTIPTIEHHPELREKVESFPLWKLCGEDQAVFINQQMFDALNAAGVTGINIMKNRDNPEEGSVTVIP